tara:strand:+ start:558 stop:782 length:225 start_codon:yes stop_codon:yes gene_type:complete
MIYLSDWSLEDKNKLCSQKWAIEGDDDWYREDLYHTDLLVDDWTCDSLIESINKDIEEKLSVQEILEKYVKSQE